jgi:beta-lactamase regulating signal transducer with metallopeptidase domain
MNGLAWQGITETMVQVTVERILNTLPEGLLIALFAGALLRVWRRQNSGTRFAVWFLALLAVAAIPLVDGFGGARALPVPGMAWGNLHPAISIPGSWALGVFLVWAAGASLALARLVAGFWRLREIRRGCTKVVVEDLDATVRATVESIVAQGSRLSATRVTIATSESVSVPAAIGLWQRTIVLPAWALRELPPADLNAILLHEYAHLNRADDWTNLVQKVVRAVFFFHPAVWWIERRLSVEREMACDDAVLAQTSNPHGYANCLVSLLEKSVAHRARPGWSLVHAAVDRAREAALRLARILDTERPTATGISKPALGLAGAFTALCLAVLPSVPQFVAFDRSVRTDGVATAQVETLGLPEGGFAVPARVRPGNSPQPRQRLVRDRGNLPGAAVAGMKRDKGFAAPVVDRGGPTVVSARSSASQVDEAAVAAAMTDSGYADTEFAPQLQTVVFIETTNWGNAAAPVWRVRVWQVTFVSVIRERYVTLPATSSI